MGVLEDHQHRRLPRDHLDLADQRLHRFLPALLRNEVRRGIAAVVGQGQQLGQKRGVLARGSGGREERVELVELRLRVIVAREPSRARHMADDRMERAVGVLRRTEIAQPYMRFTCQTLKERRRQSRLADASLAREQHDLTLARLRLGPEAKQEFALFVAPDAGRSARPRAAPRNGSPANSP